MTENKRFKSINCGLQGQYIKDNGNVLTIDDVCELLNELNRLAEGNEETLLKVMTYLHDEYYGIWEEVNKECF